MYHTCRRFAAPLLPAVFLLLLIPVLCLAEGLPEKIPVLGGSKAFMPSYADSRMFLGSIFVGLIAGLITGVIGAGGGYVLTPALMSFGVRGIMAVGTDQFHLFAKAIMGTTLHRRMGNVHFGLAAWFVAGSLVGVTAGGRVNRAVFQHSPALSDALISTVYVIVLGILGLYAIADWLRRRKAGPDAAEDDETLTAIASFLQRLPLRPRIRFDHAVTPGGRSISVYPVIACGLVVGFVAAIMGVGGGFLTFPMFVYGLGVSTFTTVGTDILQIIFTTSVSSIFQYAVFGFVFYTVSVGMLLGSLIGVQVGALVTRMVRGAQIRAFYALTILAGFSNRVCALPRKLADLGYLSLSRETSVVIETIGTVLFFGIVGFFSVWILVVFARNVPAIRAGSLGPGRAGLVVDPRKFRMGVVGLLLFFGVLAAGLSPIIGGKTAVAWADDLFNQLAKHSCYHVDEAQRKAAAYAGMEVDFGIRPRDFADQAQLVRILYKAGVTAASAPDGRVRVRGDLGRLSQAALEDAEMAFRNEAAALQAKHGMTAHEVVYGWWIVFDGLTRRFTQEDRGTEANFARFVTAKVLEPAYNFRGIEARPIGANLLPVCLLLGFYVAYTLWYGFSILFLFEGLGIRAVEAKK